MAVPTKPPNAPAWTPRPFPRLGLRPVRTWLAERYHAWLTDRHWSSLRALGMHIGANVNLPHSVWIDTSHCHLISIGDNSGFGEGVCILAHDALANEFIDATRIGRVIIHESCHIGARAVILPGVEIGPRSIVGAGSVVTRSVPPDSVAAGNPARVLCALPDHLARLKARMGGAPTFPYPESDLRFMSEAAKARMRAELARGDGFIVGGYAAQLAGTTDQKVT